MPPGISVTNLLLFRRTLVRSTTGSPDVDIIHEGSEWFTSEKIQINDGQWRGFTEFKISNNRRLRGKQPVIKPQEAQKAQTSVVSGTIVQNHISNPQAENDSVIQDDSHLDISGAFMDLQNDASEKIRSLDISVASEDKWVRRGNAFIRILKIPRNFKYMPAIGPGIRHPSLLQKYGLHCFRMQILVRYQMRSSKLILTRVSNFSRKQIIHGLGSAFFGSNQTQYQNILRRDHNCRR